MNAVNPTISIASEPKTRPGALAWRIFKKTWIWAASIVFAYMVVLQSWVASGSAEWELQIDRDGTQVYSMKIPGDSTVKFRGVTQYDYSYSQMLSAFVDAESFTQDCGKLAAGCVEYRFLQPFDPVRKTNTQYWRTELFPPFSNREVLVRGSIVQDPNTREILLENTAVPSLLPPNDCCVRITQLHNTWKYTPLANGKVQVEYVQNFAGGGFLPDFLMSFGGEQVYQLMHSDIPKLLDNDKYRKARLDFILEYKPENPAS